MLDKQGRNIDYARISITDRCNLRCVYCLPEQGVERLLHEQILTYEEIERVCKCLAELGIKKIKLTGGEPLVRPNCATLVKKIKNIPGIEKVTLTTNGILLKEQMKDLAEAGIDAINISLDTIDSEVFRQITRRDKLQEVLEGIETALSYPEIPVKINSVPVSTDPQNFVKMAELAKKYPMHVRFIEMMPIGYGKQFPFQDEESIKQILEEAYGPMIPCQEKFGNGPCHYYSIPGFKGKIGFISAITHKFCHQCNRVRMTAEGYMKSCLQYEVGAELREILRSDADDEALKQVIANVIWNKPIAHHFYEEKSEQDERRGMSKIGG